MSATMEGTNIRQNVPMECAGLSAAILRARAELYSRCVPTHAYLHFVQSQRLDILQIGGFCGTLAVAPIVAFDRDMFDFAAPGGEGMEAAICEAFGEDGEDVIDLVAWPLKEPRRVLTMFRRASLLGLWQPSNPASYIFGRPLDLHRSPLDWLRANCHGAAIAVPELVARHLLDAPGRIAPRDYAHACEIEALFSTLMRGRLMVPRQRAA